MEATAAPTAPATCTVVTGAEMHRCGAPAVLTFTGRDGELFAECEGHALPLPAAAPAPVAPGARVRVRHAGVEKIGTVLTVARTRARVEVPVYTGTRRAGTKAVTFDLADITPA